MFCSNALWKTLIYSLDLVVSVARSGLAWRDASRHGEKRSVFAEMYEVDGSAGCKSAEICDEGYVNPASLLRKVRMIGY